MYLKKKTQVAITKTTAAHAKQDKSNKKLNEIKISKRNVAKLLQPVLSAR